MKVDIFVSEPNLIGIEEWLANLPRDNCGRVRYQMKNFVWHSPRWDGPSQLWRAKALIHFVEDADATAFKLRFKTIDEQ